MIETELKAMKRGVSRGKEIKTAGGVETQSNEEAVFRAIRKMIVDSAPEKKHDLEVVWSEYAPVFSPSHDKPGFSIEAGPYGLLVFTHRTMLQIWILGFAAWKCLYSYGAVLLLLQWYSQPFELASIKSFLGQAEADREFEDLVNKVKYLREVENLEDFQWPSSVPLPETFEPQGTEDSAIFDLVCMSTAYIFLHEVQHIKFIKHANPPQDPLEEELECDRFGRSMLLDNIVEYCQNSGYPLQKVQSKRAMAIALASFLILELTPKKLWGGSRSHPPISLRIKQLIESISLPAEDVFWNFLDCLLLSKLRIEKRIPPKIAFVDAKDLCMKLLDHLS